MFCALMCKAAREGLARFDVTYTYVNGSTVILQLHVQALLTFIRLYLLRYLIACLNISLSFYTAACKGSRILLFLILHLIP